MDLEVVKQNAVVWSRDFLKSWRTAWGVASPAVQKEVAKTFGTFLQLPVRVHALVRSDADVPVVAFAVVFLESHGVSDDFGVTVLDAPATDGWIQSISGSLEQFWQNIRTNWFSGRVADPSLEPFHVRVYPVDGEARGRALIVPGGPDDLGAEIMVAAQFATINSITTVTATSVTADPAPQHLFGLHEARERTAIERWLFGHCDDFMSLMGLHSGWWCALSPLRTEVFGSGDGDVDILAGPLDFDFDATEWKERLRVESSKHRLATDRSFIVRLATNSAAAEGHVTWPPRTDHTIAWEVKASRYSDAGWQTTHLNEGRRVKAQLRLLLDRGVDRVGFLHLVATAPRDRRSGNTWLAAGRDVDSALATIAPIFDPNELPACAYLAAVLGAIDKGEEDFEGAAGATLLQRPSTNPASATARTEWRERLRERLSSMPRPGALRTLVLRCERCGEWRHSGISRGQAVCPCPSTGGPRSR